MGAGGRNSHKVKPPGVRNHSEKAKASIGGGRGEIALQHGEDTRGQSPPTLAKQAGKCLPDKLFMVIKMSFLWPPCTICPGALYPG